MTAVLLDIADAVTTVLNDTAQEWSLPFAAVRRTIPRLRRADLRDLQVTVTPKSRASALLTRGSSQRIVEIYVGLQQHLASDEDPRSDALIALGEEIAEYFDRATLPVHGACCIAAKFGDPAEAVHISVQDENELLVYTGVILLTFLFHQSR